MPTTNGNLRPIGASTPSVRDTTEELLIASEEVLLGRAGNRQTRVGRSGSAAWSALGSPVALVVHGATQVRRRTVVAIGLLALAGLVINGTLTPIIGEALLRQLNAGWAMLTIFALLLPSPTSIGFGAYTDAELQRAYGRLGGLATVPMGALEAYRVLLCRAEQRATQRLSALKWAMGAAWAVVIYFGQRGFETKDGQLLGWALLPLLVTVFSLAFVTCYGRGVNAVYALAEAVLAQRALDLAHAQPAAAASAKVRKSRSVRRGERRQWQMRSTERESW
ncbi:MAG TPA: hypothetical protein VLI72_02265 [Methylibium sp.]|nr:hypothetical protein [Methylibium sp.]